MSYSILGCSRIFGGVWQAQPITKVVWQWSYKIRESMLDILRQVPTSYFSRLFSQIMPPLFRSLADSPTTQIVWHLSFNYLTNGSLFWGPLKWGPITGLSDCWCGTHGRHYNAIRNCFLPSQLYQPVWAPDLKRTT